MQQSRTRMSGVSSVAKIILVALLSLLGLTVIGVGQAAAVVLPPTITGMSSGFNACTSTVAPPVTTGLSGPATGWTTLVTQSQITLCGTNFTASSTVYFGTDATTMANNALATVIVKTAKELWVTVPAAAKGSVPVTIFVTSSGPTTPISSATCAAGVPATTCQYSYTWSVAPILTLISPAEGPLAGGTTVTVTGSDLAGASAVMFGATPAASYTVTSSVTTGVPSSYANVTTLTAVAPANLGTKDASVNLTVTTPFNTSTSTPATPFGIFTYLASPTVTGVRTTANPASGPTGGGTYVTIDGTGFGTDATVKFGTVAATSQIVNSVDSITAVAPPGTGPVDITVHTAQGTTPIAPGADIYTYNATPSIVDGTASYSTTISNSTGIAANAPVADSFNAMTLVIGGTSFAASTLSVVTQPSSGAHPGSVATTSAGQIIYTPAQGTPAIVSGAGATTIWSYAVLTTGTQTATLQMCVSAGVGCKNFAMTYEVADSGYYMGNEITAGPATVAVVEDTGAGVNVPKTAASGSTITTVNAPSMALIPSLNSGFVVTSVGGYQSITPVPTGLTLVPGSLVATGGDTNSTGKFTAAECTAAMGYIPNQCTAQINTGNYKTTYPYIETSLNAGYPIPGGVQLTLPTITAQWVVGAPGTISSYETEFAVTTTVQHIGTAVLDAYPTDYTSYLNQGTDNPPYPKLPAYAAPKARYTINVPSSGTATTTAITAPTLSPTYGDTVTYSANVTSSSATGTVAFTAGLNALCTGTIVGGAASCTASNAPAGAAQTLTAIYSGDSTYSTSTGTASLTVAKASSATGITCTAGPFTYNGSAQTPCTAAVTGAGSLSTSATVIYASNTNAGTATADATFAGDANHDGSSATQVTFSIAKAASATVVTCTAGPFTYNGSPQTPCTAAVTGVGGLSTTATVTYASNTNAGTATADATFAGDANHDGSSATQVTFSIAKAAASTPTITNLPSFGVTGDPYIAAVATTGDGTTSVTATGACSASGLTVTFNSAGACSVTPEVGGGTNYIAASGTLVGITVYDLPATPGTVTAIAGVNSAQVSWSQPAGGTTVTGFTVTAAPGGASSPVASSASTASVVGLQAGVSYTFTVTALTDGPSSDSAPSNAVVPVAVAPNSSASNSGTDPTATTNGGGTSVTASTTGDGTVTVSTYPSNPVAALAAGSSYFDVAVSPGSTFTAINFRVCGLSSGQSVVWWNPAAQAWQAVSDFTAVDASGCTTVTVNGTTSPSLSQLEGTVFASVTSTGSAIAGYWTATANGAVLTNGAAVSYGSAAGLALAAPIVALVPTPDRHGYWLVASDGGVFSYGDAVFYGSTGAIHLNKPIVGMASTSDGKGYWLVAADGGVFAYGDAAFAGSTGAQHLNKPIVGMAGNGMGGYLLVASDGGVFAFGSAPFLGSAGALTLASPVVGIAALVDGSGYYLVAADGGVFAYGAAPFLGSAAGSANTNVVGITTGYQGGYVLASANGGVFNYGTNFYGAAGAATAPVVGIAA